MGSWDQKISAIENMIRTMLPNDTMSTACNCGLDPRSWGRCFQPKIVQFVDKIICYTFFWFRQKHKSDLGASSLFQTVKLFDHHIISQSVRTAVSSKSSFHTVSKYPANHNFLSPKIPIRHTGLATVITCSCFQKLSHHARWQMLRSLPAGSEFTILFLNTDEVTLTSFIVLHLKCIIGNKWYK